MILDPSAIPNIINFRHLFPISDDKLVKENKGLRFLSAKAKALTKQSVTYIIDTTVSDSTVLPLTYPVLEWHFVNTF